MLGKNETGNRTPTARTSTFQSESAPPDKEPAMQIENNKPQAATMNRCSRFIFAEKEYRNGACSMVPMVSLIGTPPLRAAHPRGTNLEASRTVSPNSAIVGRTQCNRFVRVEGYPCKASALRLPVAE